MSQKREMWMKEFTIKKASLSWHEAIILWWLPFQALLLGSQKTEKSQTAAVFERDRREKKKVITGSI